MTTVMSAIWPLPTLTSDIRSYSWTSKIIHGDPISPTWKSSTASGTESTDSPAIPTRNTSTHRVITEISTPRGGLVPSESIIAHTSPSILTTILSTALSHDLDNRITFNTPAIPINIFSFVPIGPPAEPSEDPPPPPAVVDPPPWTIVSPTSVSNLVLVPVAVV